MYNVDEVEHDILYQMRREREEQLADAMEERWRFEEDNAERIDTLLGERQELFDRLQMIDTELRSLTQELRSPSEVK